MKLDQILKLGHPKLYERSELISAGELASLQPVVRDLREILMEFKAKRLVQAEPLRRHRLG